MIRFFSKIRKSTLDEGKARKYLKYAIGEVFLVVVGILIALQINNWNEGRQLQSERNTYLSQKLANLEEDRERLLELKSNRLQKARDSKKILDVGLDNEDVDFLAKSLLLIFIERHFVSTIERNESSITKYYSGEKEKSINQKEQLYVNRVSEILFEENRLNSFSENAELSLWTNGFFNDNRTVFTAMPSVAEVKSLNGKAVKLIFSNGNAKKALEGIIRRNEIANPSLVVKIDELISINKQLTGEINSYLRDI